MRSKRSKRRSKQSELRHLLVVEFDKPERLRAFAKIADRFTDRWYWVTLGSLWTMSESLYAEQDILAGLLGGRSAQLRGLMMDRDERKVWRSLKPRVRVYRGCWSGNAEGWAWTLDRDKAIWFANRCPMDGQPLLLAGYVAKANIIAYFDERGEREVVLNPRHVERVTSKRLPPRLPTTHNLMYQRVQAGGRFGDEEKMWEMAIVNAKLEGRPQEAVIDDLPERARVLRELGFVEKAAVRDRQRAMVERLYSEESETERAFRNNPTVEK